MNKQLNISECVVLAVALHTAVAYGVLWNEKPIEKQLSAQEKGVALTLNRSAYQQILQDQQAKKQQAIAKQVVAQAVKPKKITVKKTKKMKVIQQLIVKQEMKAETVTYQVAEKAIEAVEPVKMETNEIIKVASMADTPIRLNQAEPANVQPKSSEGNDGAQNEKPLDMRDSATKQYLSKLMRHLQRYKQYPAKLKKNHVEGRPVVRFSINKSGHVTNVEVKRHSKSAELDQTAMDVFRRASPLPKIPSELGRETLTMSLPIEYSLIND